MLDWELVLDTIYRRIGEKAFQAWFAPTRLLYAKGDSIALEVPNPYFQLWFAERYEGILREVIEQLGRSPFEIRYQVRGEQSGLLPQGRTESPFVGTLNGEFSFHHFIEDHSNKLSLEISKRIAAFSTNRYNPFLICARGGYGKTHLLQAIGNHVVRYSKDKRVCYVDAANFIKCLELHAKQDTVKKVRSYFSHVDLLLFDDIQQLAYHRKQQEEFVVVFNTMYNAQKQIVASVNRLPKDIPGLEEGFRSRLTWGLVTEITGPSIELKRNVLIRKCDAEGITLPSDVVSSLVNQENVSLKYLEQCVIRLAAHLSLSKRTLDLRKAVFLLGSSDEESETDPIRRLKGIACRFFDVSMKDMDSNSKIRKIAFARQVAMYLARTVYGEPYSRIGVQFGGKDHAGVIRACRKIEQLTEEDPEVRKLVEDVRDLIRI